MRGRGINQIDRMVISHSDSDHVGGAATLLRHA
nr:MBL fold metallo-hydrolase [Polynucleobacter necessarius]